VLVITRAVLSRIGGSPSGALSLLGALAAWPLIAAAAPLGIRRYSSVPNEWIYELAFMAGALGIALATAARKRLEPLLEISAARPTALADASIVAVCGILFAGVTLLPAVPLGRVSDFGLGRFLPLLMVAAAGSALAMRLLSGVEAAAWSVAIGAALLPTIFPATHLLFRTTAATIALVLGATLVDHPPARHR
jgi:hypothetical protein